ncbi:hypothetical protein PR202_ga09118 [Eleusine coracana subsp. coracana]|uniref:Pectate lyase domain-containing protein n=1 Tax=Eleusine coracana subsp. coracana TaxID=191504 RepID=A0AAV5C349_ELECO|nr:hypothetical protein PR202_ga09118 [Eleusine coracana subsp. coracana]
MATPPSSEPTMEDAKSLLPYGAVDSTLRALAGQAEGFGRHAIGGLRGDVYHMTGPARSARDAAVPKPLWIVFDVSGTIHLSSGVRVSSYKTIDGRGQRVKLSGKGLQLRECEHVIVCCLEIAGCRGHDADAVQIKPRAHVEDRCVRVTIHHCFFDGTRQRHPRVRFARVHLYNNYTRDWGIYAVCASVDSQIISQCNIYKAGEKKEGLSGTWKSRQRTGIEARAGAYGPEGDLFLNGGEECATAPYASDAAGDEPWDFEVQDCYQSCSVQPASMALKKLLQCCTGWEPVPLPLDLFPSTDTT